MSPNSVLPIAVTVTDLVKEGETYVASGSLFSFSISFSSNRIDPKLAGPLFWKLQFLSSLPGTTETTLVPRLSNWFLIYFLSPRPKEVNKTTDKTPIRIPKEVKNVRPLFLEKSDSADLIIKKK